jgi:hypothetical protein
LFMISFFSRNDGWIRWQHEMNSRIWYQVGLELSDIDVQSTIESQRCSQWRDNLRDQSVQVGVGRSFNIKISSADIIDCFIIKHNSNISVLQ